MPPRINIPRGSVYRELARLTILADGLISLGARPKSMTESLIKAHRLFLRGALGGVLANSTHLLSLPRLIEELDLPLSIYYALKDIGISKVPELLILDESVVAARTRLSDIRMGQLKEALDSFGLRLGMKKAEVERAYRQKRKKPRR